MSLIILLPLLHISIHALHEESDPVGDAFDFRRGISIHALHEESDRQSGLRIRHQAAISIHALHEESDQLDVWTTYAPTTFQSTLSMRRATPHDVDSANRSTFQSTLSMRRATLRRLVFVPNLPFQSTLSMRRATHAGLGFHHCLSQFQSTLSMRRAT